MAIIIIGHQTGAEEEDGPLQRDTSFRLTAFQGTSLTQLLRNRIYFALIINACPLQLMVFAQQKEGASQ